MNGYSKIKFNGSTKSRSMDFSEESDPLSNFSHPPKATQKTSPNHPFKPQEITKKAKNINTHDPPSSDLLGDEDHVNGDRFGGVLSRESSVPSSTASSNRFRLDKKLRAFSMRRSSSVSERYCRIHDQWGSLSSPLDGEGDEGEGEGMDNYNPVKARSMKKKNKILKACKRIFGF